LEKAKARALALKSNASPKEVAAAVAKEPVSSSRIALTPEDKLIADSFKANRGVFLACRERFISLGYGDQAHPIYNLGNS
jgi:UDP-N-acetylmuramyl pentapeptide synthase